MQNDSPFVILSTSVAAKELAREIALEMLENGTIACCNIIPSVESLYRWKGEIASSSECILLMKTTKTLAKKAVTALEKLHPYECPVIEVIAVSGMNVKAKRWIEEILES